MTQDDFLAQWKKVFDAGVIDQAAFEAATKGIAGQLAGAVAIVNVRLVLSMSVANSVITFAVSSLVVADRLAAVGAAVKPVT